MPNRLAEEQSPYLLQHKNNPVDWYAWGEEAFEAARQQDKPIFLSIGYSTCHWCHVMEEESFEDEEVAEVLNETFIPIKVDREERPDVDNIYMTVCQMMTGRGGWPLNVLLTPDRRPFYATTYLPKRGRMRRMGVIELAERVSELWEDDRERLLSDAQEITDALQTQSADGDGAAPGDEALDRAFDTLSNRFDEAKGGFGSQPKFPSPHNLLFLLRHWHRTGHDRALEMVTRQLDAMRIGGIFDHVGYGFHRYSTDRQWLLPHFEKMLYDQATLAMAYTEAYHVTGNETYERTAREIYRYVERDLISEEGAFYSAEDADSLTDEGEREEGAFYVWTVDEIRDVLPQDDAEMVIDVFNLREGGNYADESTGQKTGTNILHLQQPIREAARERGDDPDALAQRWERARRSLLDARNRQRARPGLDDKVLTDWNGLMIAAMARSARVFDPSDEIEQRAVRAATFLLDTMRDDDGRLMHRYRHGDVAIRAHLDDYAFLVWGLIELYQTTFDARWLGEAMCLTDEMIEHFHDDAAGAFFFTADDAEALITRQKEFYDGAMPSGNSAALLNLVRLSRLTGRTDYADRADALMQAVGTEVSSQPAGFTGLLTGVQTALTPSREIVISGDADDPRTNALLAEVRRRYLPGTVVLHRPDEDDPLITSYAAFTEAQTPVDGRPAAYVCRDFACRRPVTEPDLLGQQLDEDATVRG